MTQPSLHDPDQRAQARRELQQKDPKLGRLVTYYGDPWPSRKTAAFPTLARILVGQQISVKAAATIFGRLQACCGGKIEAATLARLDAPALQACGLSRQKRAGLRDLSDRVLDRRLRPGQLWRLDDDSVRDAVTSVRGLGPWSAEIFLMFGLGRPDLLPTNDLGLQAGIRAFLGSPKGVTPKRMESAARLWRPWRTLACLYLWALLDNPPTTRENR
jgi:DNA-3-methyladenine glycosylase II